MSSVNAHLTEQNIIQILEQASNPQHAGSEVQRLAEQQLKAWEVQPGFHYLLQSIYLDLSNPLQVRWLAVIQFKNGVDKYWRSSRINAIKKDEKASIRARLFDLIDEQNNQLCIQNAQAASKISRLDFPAEWPNLIIVTMTGLLVLDLLSGKIINGFDLYPYVNENFKNGHLNRLISCDEKNGKIALVINQREDSDKTTKIKFKSHVLVFNSNLTHQLGNFTHDQYIAWIGWNHDTDFFFIDVDSKLGIVSTTMNTEIADEVNKEGILDGLSLGMDVTTTNNNNPTSHTDYLDELRKLAASKQKPLEQQDNSTKNNNNDDEDDDLTSEIINGERNTSTINMNSFSNMFENIQNVSMSTLFDNVIKTLN